MTGFQKPHQNFFHPFAIFSPTKYNLYVVHQQNGSPSLHAHTTTLCTIIVTNASQIRLHPGANYLVPLITRTKYKLHSPKDRYTAHDVQFCLGTRTECDWSGSVCCCSVCSTEINHRLRVPVPTYYSVETREQYTEKRVVLLSHSSPYNQPVCSRITSYSSCEAKKNFPTLRICELGKRKPKSLRHSIYAKNIGISAPGTFISSHVSTRTLCASRLLLFLSIPTWSKSSRDRWLK